MWDCSAVELVVRRVRARMNSIAIILAMLVAGSDAGVDAPVADQGVNEVVRAELPDGGVLGEGWHLTRERMHKVGTRLVSLENDLNQTKAERDAAKTQPKLLPASFWVGVAIGAVVTGAAAIAVVKVMK